MVIYNKDMDFVNFSTNIIKEIDSIRSIGKDSNSPQESRINAFYRAIGLPGFKTNDKKQTLSGNNGNIFDQTSIDSSIILQLVSREELFKKNMASKSFDGYLLDYNESKVTDSINPSNNRAQLFPMFVNIDVDIFPQGKRVGGAFMTDAQLQDACSNDKTKYHRPLIETILSLRLNELGAFNSIKQSAIKSDVFNEFQQLGVDLKNAVELSLGSAVVKMSEVKKSVDEIRKRTSAQIVPSDNPEQNPVVLYNSDNPAELEMTQEEQNQYILLKEARLVLFNFDDTSVNSSETRNLKEAVLASNLLDVVVSDGGLIKKSKSETGKKIDKTQVDLKQSFRDLDTILGTFSGLSGVDALVVILALFTVDIDSLVKLINYESQVRLSEQTGVSLDFNGTAGDAIDAVQRLQEKVSEILYALDKEMGQYKYKNRKENQKP